MGRVGVGEEAGELRQAPRAGFLRRLGPGLITGAADDDPSGIATYSQAGAQFGSALLWTSLFSLPLMIAVQLASARLGRVTGRGLAANIRLHRSRPVLQAAVGLLLTANTINIAADIAAMGEALQLIAGGGEHGHALLFGLALLVVQVVVSYRRLVLTLKWLTLALFAYVGVLLVVDVPWGEALFGVLVPRLQLTRDCLTTVMAVLGTTISPYLFFWQASQEVEEMREHGAAPLLDTPGSAHGALRRTQLDTVVGMTFSNFIAFCIMLTVARTLHPAGVVDIRTSAQAAQALRPIAGDYASWLFAAGIVGTGLLAVPVLAGSAAYAMAEAFGWREGLRLKLAQARGFYAMIAMATLGGTALDFTALDPVKALYWSAVLNGVVAVPIMALLMGLVGDRAVMGALRASAWVRALGWLATGLMGALAAWMIGLQLL